MLPWYFGEGIKIGQLLSLLRRLTCWPNTTTHKCLWHCSTCNWPPSASTPAQSDYEQSATPSWALQLCSCSWPTAASPLLVLWRVSTTKPTIWTRRPLLPLHLPSFFWKQSKRIAVVHSTLHECLCPPKRLW